MLLPLLSESDPVASSEGSIDPLGFYAIADSLGVQLIPGVRERMQHPRFLTAIAVSLEVCKDFEEDRVAADKISEPWQVFEWYAVEGYVRTITDPAALQGIPGRDKTTRALRDHVPLSARRYLKNPQVFGFNGVYRPLSRTLGIETVGRLGESGYELLSTWAEEQDLPGVIGTHQGSGAEIRRLLHSAVHDGLTKGASDRNPGWGGWKFFADHLAPLDIGRNEAKVIAKYLSNRGKGYREPVIKFLTSAEGREIWKNSESERQFHLALKSKSDAGLKALLDAILTYEEFSRYLQDAFDDCLHHMARKGGKATPGELARVPSVQTAAQHTPPLFERLIDLLSPFGESIRFQEVFGEFGVRCPEEDWPNILLEHHKKVQLRKPPNGKNPWFERFDDGSCILRPQYDRGQGGRHDGEYVNAYRTTPLWSFAEDLNLVQ